MRAFRRPVLALALTALAGAVAAQAQAQAPQLPAPQIPAPQTPTSRTVPHPLNPPPVSSAPTLGGVTVEPQAPPQGHVVSSTDAAPLTSPYYTDQDAQPAPRALSFGNNGAVGVESVDSAPIPGTPSNLDPGGAHGDIGLTAVF